MLYMYSRVASLRLALRTLADPLAQPLLTLHTPLRIPLAQTPCATLPRQLFRLSILNCQLKIENCLVSPDPSGMALATFPTNFLRFTKPGGRAGPFPKLRVAVAPGNWPDPLQSNEEGGSRARESKYLIGPTSLNSKHNALGQRIHHR